jgi:hypothetical protein
MRTIRKFDDFVKEGLNPRDLRGKGSEEGTADQIWKEYAESEEGKKHIAELQKKDKMWWSNAAIDGDAFSSHRNRFIDEVVPAAISKHGKAVKPNVKTALEDIIIDMADEANYADYKGRK